MDKPLFQIIPLRLIFVATVGFILLWVEIGFRAGVFHARKSEGARQASIDPLAGATLIADLDRPDAGFLTVSQQSLSDLQTSWHRK